MLNKSNAISFVGTTNAAKARKFYEKVLGLAVASDEPFAVVFEVNGRMLRVAKVAELTPAKHTVLGWDVADIAATVRQLIKKGVCFERYEGMGQDELGVWISPSGARVAWFKDPDGNVLSLTQFSGNE